MSNHLAIATVTACLRQLLYDAVSLDVNGTDVTILAPDDAALKTDAPRLNLYLYQVSPSPAWANADLPTRRQDSSVAQRPRLGLNLHYLISVHGKAATDDAQPHRVLGSALRALHEQPVLTRDAIRACAQGHALAGSDLADQVDTVRLSPLCMTLDEVSKLWTMLQSPYRLSVAYTAGVVLIDGRLSPRPALPVAARHIVVDTLRRPEIVAVEPASLEHVVGAQLTINGRHLRADTVGVCIGNVNTVPEPPLDDTRLVVRLPAGLRAGVNTLYVRHARLLGVPPTPHSGVESNISACIIRPRMLGASPYRASCGAALDLACDPPVGRSQQVSLLAGMHQIDLAPRPADAPDASASLRFMIPADFPVGSHLLRLRVDGAESALQAGPDAQAPAYAGPILEVAPA